jgi:methionyl-tRNA formyltransferase
MGSPEFALPDLKSLVNVYSVVGVVTQPDRPAGRGRTMTPPAVKILAQELQLPCIQPLRLRSPEAIAQLRAWQPDLIIVAAFGQILRPEVLDLPRFGCINVHGSLLPRWRGAAPIQAAIVNGDTQTGITIMRMDAGIDTGPFLSQRSIPILPEDTTTSLSQRLSRVGAELLMETLPGYLNGELVLHTQDETVATYAPMLKKEDGQLDFTLPAMALVRQVHAFTPWPGAYTIWKDQPFKVRQAMAKPMSEAMASSPSLEPGYRTIVNGLPAILTSDGILILEEVQPAGKKPIPGSVFLQGARDWGKDE